MKKFSLLFAGLYLAAMLGGIPGAQAHTSSQCIKEIKISGTLCKFSPTAWILGFCKNKKVLQWCSEKKKHDDKFHK